MTSMDERLAEIVREVISPLRAEVQQLAAALRAAGKAPEREWLTTADVARELEVTPATVRAWVKAGRLRAAPGTRYRRIHRDEFDRFLAGVGASDGANVESLVARLRKVR